MTERSERPEIPDKAERWTSSLERFALNSPDMPDARARAILGLVAEARRLRETRDCVGMLERVGHAKLSHWLRETLELREKVARLRMTALSKLEAAAEKAWAKKRAMGPDWQWWDGHAEGLETAADEIRGVVND